MSEMLIQEDPSLAAKRRLAMLMMQQGQTPIQSGNPLEAILRGLQTGYGVYSDAKANKEEKSGRDKLIAEATNIQTAADNLKQSSAGLPVDFSAFPEFDTSGLAAATPEQKRRALIDRLVASENPSLKMQGMQLSQAEMLTTPTVRVYKPGDTIDYGDGRRETIPEVQKPKFAVGDTRTIRRGQKDVTEEKQADGTWKEIGSGDAFAPDRNGDRVQTITTDAGIFRLMPDGSLGERYGDAPRSAQPLTATQQRELFDAEDIVNSSQMAVLSLDRALKLNDRAASGYAAKIEQGYNRAFDKKAAADTTQFNTEVLDQALGSLKSTFGAAPTEGERQILLQMQAAPEMTRAERKQLLERAKAAAQQRLAFSQRRVESINGNAAQRGQVPLMAQPAQPATPAQPAPSALDAPADMGGITPEDIAFTAQKHGLSEDEVRRRLGIGM